MSRRRSGSRSKAPAPDFWGESPGRDTAQSGREQSGPAQSVPAQSVPAQSVPAQSGPEPRIRPSSDPAALPRSLGAPPLAMSPAMAMGSLTAIYEEAVRAASALAASCGLLAEDGAEG